MRTPKKIDSTTETSLYEINSYIASFKLSRTEQLSPALVSALSFCLKTDMAYLKIRKIIYISSLNF